MRSKQQREIDNKVLDFTVELFKILFMKNTQMSEKYQMLVVHILENKLWFAYFLGFFAIVLIIIATSI